MRDQLLKCKSQSHAVVRRHYQHNLHTYIYEAFLMQKLNASAGSRTRVDCLEGNHADRYTTDASTAVYNAAIALTD